MENFDHILLFKTSCSTIADKLLLRSLLEKKEGIEQWNLDLDDCDCVLRIVTYTLDKKHITQLLHHHGYECCELI